MRRGGCPKTEGSGVATQGRSAGHRRGVQTASAWSYSAEPLMQPRPLHVPQPPRCTAAPTSHAVSLPPHPRGHSAEQPTGHALSRGGPGSQESSAAWHQRPPPPFPGLCSGCGPSVVSRGHWRDAAGERFSLPDSGHSPDGGQCKQADLQVPRELLATQCASPGWGSAQGWRAGSAPGHPDPTVANNPTLELPAVITVLGLCPLAGPRLPARSAGGCRGPAPSPQPGPAAYSPAGRGRWAPFIPWPGVSDLSHTSGTREAAEMTQALGQRRLHSSCTSDSSVAGGHNPASLSVWISVGGSPPWSWKTEGCPPEPAAPPWPQPPACSGGSPSAPDPCTGGPHDAGCLLARDSSPQASLPRYHSVLLPPGPQLGAWGCVHVHSILRPAHAAVSSG